MEAGKLNKRISLKSPPTTQDEYGAIDMTTGWTTVTTVWASIEPLSAKQLELARAFAPSATHLVTIRYLSTNHKTLTGYRVYYGSRVLSISGVLDPEEKHEKLMLYCTEVN